ncbi:MAG TPA: YtxH domain-containing protein, partial [Gemmatimonadales bacterium]|nr:YtxH domain-containing protein [Gemmatimonadales bacterium]
MHHDKDEDERGAGGLVAGVILGAIIGAGIALLVAPRSGEETRRQISRRAREFGDDARDRIGEASKRTRRELRRR